VIALILAQNILLGNISCQNIRYHFSVKKNIIGSRVREGRMKANPLITQKDLVARLQVLGLSIEQSAISKIENRQRPVTDIECAKLAEALSVPVGWLYGED